jgi:hypothetical protein
MESDLTATGNGPTSVPAAQHGMSGGREYSDEEVRQLVAALEEPFDPRDIKWRVTSTSSDRRRGQMIAYADPRAYTDRLNELFTVEVQSFNRCRAQIGPLCAQCRCTCGAIAIRRPVPLPSVVSR